MKFFKTELHLVTCLPAFITPVVSTGSLITEKSAVVRIRLSDQFPLKADFLIRTSS